jgi:hypothetical protein
MRFHEGQRVYQAVLIEFEGRLSPAVVPAVISVVAPQRDGSTRYRVRAWAPTALGTATYYDRVENQLADDPEEAMRMAVRAAALRAEERSHG